MKNPSLKVIALLAFTVVFILHAPLHATTILAGTSPAIIEMDTNGLLDDIGTYGTGTLSLSGAGTRMIWYPGKAAFRAGYVSGTQWNDANIGAYSVAFGYNSTASGSYSVAMGSSSASGSGATALSGGAASGVSSVALGASTASGSYSTAMGLFAYASGYNSMAAGYSAANGDYSTALGRSTANGIVSVAAGNNVTVGSFGSCAVGDYNVNKDSSGAAPTATSWVSTDPLFEVGNGSYNSSTLVTTYSDALVVYKNGNTTINGNLTVNGSLSSSLTSLALLPSASATGTDAVALGYTAAASGNYAFASGNTTTASGVESTAIDYSTLASGQYSTAMGNSTTASGQGSTAAGEHTTATAYDSFVVGRYNTGGGTTGLWVNSDPLFEVGNGTSGTPSDALKVDKSGNLTASGVITAQPGGDIPMYSGM